MQKTRAWKVPKSCIEEVINTMNGSIDPGLAVTNVIPYDEKYFLILFCGSYPFMEKIVRGIIDKNEKQDETS
jgi:hypothetical protein